MTLLRTFGLALALGMISTVALADEARVYKEGPVSVLAYIRTKSGKFDEYMKFLDTSYKADMEEEKKQGLILSYKVYSATPRTPTDPDLILETVYANMAALDKSEQEDAVLAKVAGSMDIANKGAADRESIRTELGQDMVRELILK